MTARIVSMLAIAGAIALGLAPSGHNLRHADPPSPATITGEEVVLPMFHYGNRPLVDVLINGKGPYRFILDTGAQGSVLGKALADELLLPTIGEVPLGSPGGKEPLKAALVGIETASVSGVSLSLKDAAVMDLAGYLKDPEGPKGILSARLFRGLLLSFDFPQDQIRIKPGHLAPADGAEIFEYDTDDQLPAVTLAVAGVEVEAHLDTGSPGGFTLPGSYAEKLPLESKPVEVGRARLVDREMVILGATLNGNVSIGRHLFERPEIRFAESFPVGNIGHGILRDFVVTLDFESRRIRLERTAETPAEAGAWGLGDCAKDES